MKKVSKKGFSLVEIMVVVAIFIFLTGIILVNHTQTKGVLVLGNLAYDIALSLRQAQVFGLSVKEFGVGGGEFSPGYGIHFSTGLPQNYILFADRNNNNKYDDQTEVVEVFSLGGEHTISEFCGVLSTGQEKCGSLDITDLDILFKRPDPEAIIKSNIDTDVYQEARIELSTRFGIKRNVYASVTGQISVEQSAIITQTP